MMEFHTGADRPRSHSKRHEGRGEHLSTTEMIWRQPQSYSLSWFGGC